MAFKNINTGTFIAANNLYIEEKDVHYGATLGGAILRTLLYFDIFSHPLNLGELHQYCSHRSSKAEIFEQLEILQRKGYIKRNGEHYFIGTRDKDAKVNKKVKGAEKAEKMIKTARRFSRFISFFPFVRGVCLSGSLSKGYADNKSDVDYFIITEPGRLWLCRTTLILFKKLFLFNSHKNFCVNYFIDTHSLEIPDKNIFTATELISIIPTYNHNLYKQLMQANGWLNKYFPNSVLKTSEKICLENKSGIKRFAERIFSGKAGDKLDDKCFLLTLSHWKKKFKDFDDAQFDLRLRSRKNVSKHHPLGFQEKVLKDVEIKIKNFEEKYKISLS